MAQDSDGLVEFDVGAGADVDEPAGGFHDGQRCRGRPPADPGAAAGPGGEEALGLERLVGLGDGAGGDAEVSRQLADGRESFVRGEFAGGDESANLILDLIRRWCRPGDRDHEPVVTGARLRDGMAESATLAHRNVPRTAASKEQPDNAGASAAKVVRKVANS